MLVTGDLTWCGDPHEFENAREFLFKFGKRLGLHPSQIIIVPGNHDIEWRYGQHDVNPNAEFNYINFAERFYGTKPSETLVRIHRFRLPGGTPVTVLGLNSCRIESKENAGLGFVGREQLRYVADFVLANCSANDDLRIALLHHHLVPVNYLEEINSETKRVSLTLDAEAVLQTLIGMNFRLILHGHQHQPFIAEERRIACNYVDPITKKERVLDGRIAVVGGGSAGVKQTHLNFVGRNTYNIINLAVQPNGISIQTRMRNPAGTSFVEYQNVTL